MKDEWWREELKARRADGLHRRLGVLPVGVLDLSSNDYLGLSRHPEVVAAAMSATREFGAGARASRLVSGHFEIHSQLESELAGFKECRAALVFPSGYHANMAVVTALSRRGDTIFCDKRNHASLIDACFLASAHGAKVRFYDSLEKLQKLLEGQAHAARLIVSDAIFSMDGDIAPIPELLEMAEKFDATLILDDAHGTGVLGATGHGALEHFCNPELKIQNSKLVQVGTLSKALGAQGGFVVGDETLIEWLINAARTFIYTTGLNPAACGAARASLRIIEREPQRLKRLREVKEKLARGLIELGFDAREQPTPVLPVVIGDAKNAVALSEKLLAQNIWCPAIRPPTVPKNSSRLRVTAGADFSDDDIARVLNAFAKC
jgi:glycine C-acetyltransferase/8-amino-7-oxononanoate synthase